MHRLNNMQLTQLMHLALKIIIILLLRYLKVILLYYYFTPMYEYLASMHLALHELDVRIIPFPP